MTYVTDRVDYELRSYLEDKRYDPYSLGSNDCFLFSADIIHILTGVNYKYIFEGKYKTKREALRLIEKYGGFVSAIDTHTGIQMIRVSNRDDLQNLDLALLFIDKDHMPHLGLILDNKVIMLGEKGLSSISVSFRGIKLYGYWRFLPCKS